MAEAKKSEKTKDKKVKETPKKESDKKTESEKPEEKEEDKKETSGGEKDSLDSELENIRNQLSQVNDKLLRTLAEYDNYRKRTQKEKEAI